MINALSIEDEQIFIVELKITSDLDVEGKTLKDIDISSIGSVSSVIHNGKTMIPNGQTTICAGDKVLIVTTVDNKDKVIDIFQRKK